MMPTQGLRYQSLHGGSEMPRTGRDGEVINDNRLCR